MEGRHSVGVNTPEATLRHAAPGFTGRAPSLRCGGCQEVLFDRDRFCGRCGTSADTASAAVTQPLLHETGTARGIGAPTTVLGAAESRTLRWPVIEAYLLAAAITAGVVAPLWLAVLSVAKG